MVGTAETTRQSPTTLVELIGRETLQTIQDAFATAFDIPTVILDHEGQNVNAITFRVPFCEDLTRPSPAGERCLSCDVRAMRESEVTRRPTTFRCWAGLNDSTVPIVSSDGRLFGHFLAGQVHFEAPTDFAPWRKIAGEIGINEDDYERAARAVRVIPEAVYRHRIDCLGILARMIADQASAALANRALLDDALSASEQTRRMTVELEAIASGVSLMSGTDDLLAMVTRLLDAAHEVIAFDGAAVYTRGSELEAATPVVLRDDGLVDAETYGRAADAAIERGDSLLRDEERTLSIPLILDGEKLGALVLHRHAPAVFSAHDRDLLTIVGGQVTATIGVARLRSSAQRVLAVAAARDAVLHQLAADVDTDLLLHRLLDEAVHALEADDVALLPREADAPLVVRATPAASPRIDAALEGAISRARTTGKAIAATSLGGGSALIVPAAPMGSRTGYDLVVWRHAPWSPADEELARALAAGIELVVETRRRRGAAQRGAARQRALSTLISALQQHGADGVDELDALLAAAAGVQRMIRVQPSDVEGVLIAWTRDETGDLVQRALPIEGQAGLRMPDGTGDPVRWDGWAQRVLAAIDVPAGPALLCAQAGSDDRLIALIATSATTLGDEDRLRLQTVADLLAVAAAELGARRLEDGRGPLFEQIALAARRGRTQVLDAARAGYQALGGAATDFDPAVDDPADLAAADRARFRGCVRVALEMADALDAAARDRAAAGRARALGERAVEVDRTALRRAAALAAALDSHHPATGVAAEIARGWDCSVLLQDADGWTIAGDESALAGHSLALVDDTGTPLGWLWHTFSGTPPTADWEILTATIAVRQARAALSNDDAVRAAIADALIESTELAPDLVRRCDEVGFDIAQSRRVCVIGVDPAKGTLDGTVRWLARWAAAQEPIGIVGRRERHAVLIGPDDPNWFSDAVSQLDEHVPHAHAGLGHPGYGAPGIQRSYASGRQAAEVLRVTGRAGVLEIQDDSLESILLEAADPARLVRFVESVLTPLEEYDHRRGSELLHSLETAIQLGWNLQGAARACHVHVTTFRYRLTRIEQLTGIDLTTADGRLTAELALRARRVLS